MDKALTLAPHVCRYGNDKVEFCAVNVTDWASVCTLFALASKTFGSRIDYVVRPPSRP